MNIWSCRGFVGVEICIWGEMIFIVGVFFRGLVWCELHYVCEFFFYFVLGGGLVYKVIRVRN